MANSPGSPIPAIGAAPIASEALTSAPLARLKRPWVPPVLTCESARAAEQGKTAYLSELHDGFGPAS